MKKLLNRLSYLFLFVFALASGSASQACIQEGRVLTVEKTRKETIATLENGFKLLAGPNSIYQRMFEGSMKSGHELCVSNMIVDERKPLEGYPSQIVAHIPLRHVTHSESDLDCVKKGFIRRAVTNPNYDWFYFEDGFVARVVHVSKVTPVLYEATFAKKEVCITQMDLSGSGPTWGIPRNALMMER